VTGTRTRRWRAAALAVALGASLLSTAFGTSSAVANTSTPGPDEIVTSPNMKHIANVPFQDPLKDGAVGTDIAFTDGHAIVGNYNGFTIYDIRNPKKPKIVANVLCPGAQNDVSVHKNLLFLSVDARRSDDSCNSQPQNDGTKPYWEGIRIFDISDMRNPRYVKSVETKCGSHTHTLVPARSSKHVYIYVSSYAPSPSLSNCQPPHDLISIIKVPVRQPTKAKVVATPVLFPDGGFPGDGWDIDKPGGVPTEGCHDITVYPEKNIAAGACMGDGVLMDITNREKPKVIDRVTDAEHFAFWHSATFSNDASKVVFTDELGGGGAATCNPEIGPELGANGIYQIVGKGKHRKLKFRSFYKIDRTQTDEENCVAHNGMLLPVPGKDIMVQSWYMGGTVVWDFTNARKPKTIGFFDRGPASNPAEAGGTWSSYYYNGYIYSSDLGKGFDVLRIDDKRTDPAKKVRTKVLNAQTQEHYRER